MDYRSDSTHPKKNWAWYINIKLVIEIVYKKYRIKNGEYENECREE